MFTASPARACCTFVWVQVYGITWTSKRLSSTGLVTDEVANPTYTDDLAGAVLELAATGRPGVYHLVI